MSKKPVTIELKMVVAILKSTGLGTMAEDLIEQIKAEGDEDALGYPEHKPLLN